MNTKREKDKMTLKRLADTYWEESIIPIQGRLAELTVLIKAEKSREERFRLKQRRTALRGIRNACSMLYAAAWRAARAMGYHKLITYILDGEDGASVKAAGWKCVGQAGGLRWTGKRRPEVDLYPAQMKLRFEVTDGKEALDNE